MSDFICDKCEDSGLIGVRNTFPMSYVGPGPVPDDARGVCEVRCSYCDPVARFREECDDE